MKNLSTTLLLFSFSILSYTSSNAQAFAKEQRSFSLGYGFAAYESIDDLLENQPPEAPAIGPFYLKYEGTLTSKIGFGLNVAATRYSTVYESPDYTNTNVYYFRTTKTTFSALLRLNFHIGRFEKLDPYWGFGMGYRGGASKFDSNAPFAAKYSESIKESPFGFETTIGCRYFLSDKVGAYIEAGFARSAVQVGVTVKV